MRKLWLLGALGALALTSLGVLGVMVPSERWNPPSELSALLMALSFVLPAIVPAAKPRATRSDATGIWLIGPSALLYGGLLAVAVAGLRLGLQQSTNASWAACVVWAGLLCAGWLGMRAATTIVEKAAGATRSAVDDPRTSWAAALRKMAVLATDADVVRVLATLEERMRFACNEPAGTTTPQTAAIAEQISHLQGVLGDPAQVRATERQIVALLSERESAARATKSRA